MGEGKKGTIHVIFLLGSTCMANQKTSIREAEPLEYYEYKSKILENCGRNGGHKGLEVRLKDQSLTCPQEVLV